jgi:2-polyprenyl-3-methyl-5-hydroxy-6-metoxy-1,4-benzoquinol methylase
MTDEQHHLDRIASDSRYAAGANTSTILYSFEIFQRHIAGATLLEMGPAEGLMTEQLIQLGLQMSVVEGSQQFCTELAARHPGLTVHHSLFERFEPPHRYDNIVLGHVLEHVQNPVAILRRVRTWLTDGGRVLAAVPNSRSVHRQAAVMMGLLDFEEQLNEADHHHGHRRVYNPETFRRDFREAGLSIDIFGGYWLKPVSNGQIEADWTPEMLNAFLKLGERYPDIAGEIYIVARP